MSSSVRAQAAVLAYPELTVADGPVCHEGQWDVHIECCYLCTGQTVPMFAVTSIGWLVSCPLAEAIEWYTCTLRRLSWQHVCNEVIICSSKITYPPAGSGVPTDAPCSARTLTLLLQNCLSCMRTCVASVQLGVDQWVAVLDPIG